MKRDEYTDELVDTIRDLFFDGANDPSCLEICEAHFPDRHIPGEIIASVKQRLPRIKALLETEGYQVYFVNRAYYGRFRSTMPATGEEARERLPIGGGSKTEKAQRYGIRRCTDPENDLLWQETIRHNVKTADCKLNKNKERVEKMTVEHQMSHDTIKSLVSPEA